MTNNRKTLFIGSVLAVAVLAGIVGPWMLGSDHRQSTNDAYVTADYTVVAPKVAGFIKEVLVEDNQQVTAGQLLATIDARDYQAALDAAQAQLLVAQAQSRCPRHPGAPGGADCPGRGGGQSGPGRSGVRRP
jgi:membrane fusion protein (multidrug efflux system)